MKKLKSGLFIICILIISLSLVFVGTSHAKKIKITFKEATELVDKFKSANPDVKIQDYFINKEAAGYKSEFHKELVIIIKKWDVWMSRANDTNLAADKREKAKASAIQMIEKVKIMCLKPAEKVEPAKQETVKPQQAQAAKSEVSKPEKKPEAKAENGSGAFLPKTEKGRRAMELIMNKK